MLLYSASEGRVGKQGSQRGTRVAAGDADQLPPVSSGSFLSAAIDSGVVPVVDLREVFRQAQGSDIVKAAHAVHAGRMPSLTRIDPAHPSEAGLPARLALLQHSAAGECHCITQHACSAEENISGMLKWML